MNASSLASIFDLLQGQAEAGGATAYGRHAGGGRGTRAVQDLHRQGPEHRKLWLLCRARRIWKVRRGFLREFGG